MNADRIAACAGATPGAALVYASALTMAMAEFKIDSTPQRAAMFLANVGHESGRLTRVVENLNYSVEALLVSFGRHRISEDDARAFGRTSTRPADQVAIANRLYGGEWGGRNLGNTEPFDGSVFRGRGLIQVTGRANYSAVTKRLKARLLHLAVPDFVQTPESMALPAWAAYSAADFWASRDLNALADAGNFDAVCDVINIGTRTAKVGDAKGFEERLMLFTNGKRALGVA